MVQPDPARQHTPLEDLTAVLTGTALFALGATFMTYAALPSGGTTGIALLAHYQTGFGFGLLFFLVNMPFYALSAWRMGWKLTLRTVAAVGLVAVIAHAMPHWLRLDFLNPLFGAAMAGLLMGVGLLILFRHRTSLGGFNLLALYAQERLGLRAGWVQMGMDAMVLAVATLVLPLDKVAISLIGAVTLNLVIATNHRPDRYIGVS
jgi:uncharacterized membrane-anchored protein YitT (DUF2179 family)